MRLCQGTAVIILAVGKRGQRYAAVDTFLSIEPTVLDSPDLKNRATPYLDKLNEKMARTLSAHTRLTHDLALKALTKGMHFTAHDALASGIVDFITRADNSKR
jgi:ATP-dependent protease ClpP protease subunit